MRLVGFAECDTHAITGAAVGHYADSEQALARGLLDHLGPGMLCLADRGFAGFPLFGAAAATGADLLWRAKSNAVLPVLERFADGSFRSEIVATPDKRTRANVISVRVIDYTIDDPGRPGTPERTGCSPPSPIPKPRPPRSSPPSTPNGGRSKRRWMSSRPTSGARRVVLRSRLPKASARRSTATCAPTTP